MKTNAIINTRPEAGAEAVETKVTINWENMSQENIIALAQQSLVIKLQAEWRKDGIPAGEVEVDANDYRPGTRSERKPNLEALVAKLTPEQKAALLAKLAG